MPKEGFTALRAILAVCSALGCTCSFVIFYTWARIKSLRVFPHVVTLFMTTFYFIAVANFSVPLVISRQILYCSHNDLFSSWNKATNFCLAQGYMKNTMCIRRQPSTVCLCLPVCLSIC
jgi:hypothetical protein